MVGEGVTPYQTGVGRKMNLLDIDKRNFGAVVQGILVQLCLYLFCGGFWFSGVYCASLQQ